jgi:peptide/nickel transport system permease protein
MNLKTYVSTGSWVSKVRTVVDKQREIFGGEYLGQVGLILLIVFMGLSLFAPWIAPHGPHEIQRTESGEIKSLQAPSQENPLGTTITGKDVLSQVIWGGRMSILVGVLAAFISVGIGTSVGLVSGYYGGYVDDILMRITDIAYAIPFLPFMIVLVAIIGSGLMNIVFAISLILWRSTARIIRSEVLTLKQRPYIESAESAGASDLRIILYHLFPNVMPLMLLYGTFTIAWAVLAQANLSFLGFGDPDMISWGGMIFTAYIRNVIREAWWWVIPPGVSISLFVMGWFFISRPYEKIANPELEAGK